ncbi:MAG: hypothetical protein QOG53_3606 [Frankiales bacterium]|jgi:hypothetical protein|nr:hypothetical protein [Frankiales bacterium]
MRRAQNQLVRLVPILALGLAAACGGSSDIKLTDSERDCAAVTAAARQVVLVDPRKATPEDLERNKTAAETLESAAASATTEVAEPARALAGSATAYVAALEKRDALRATANEGLLRQQAVPLAQVCGFGTRADQILGTTSGTEGTG